jgi:glycosyltransferase involved in cell wall biosynthesis
MDTVSIIIPTFNAKMSVVALLDSLLEQKDITRIIVCDDASTDGTAAHLRDRYGSRIVLLAGKNNLGPGGNRNRALKVIKTESYLLFIDADCELIYRNGIVSLVRHCFTRPTYGVVGFGIRSAAGAPMPWNFGSLMHPLRDASDFAIETLWRSGSLTGKQFATLAPVRAASLRLVPVPKAREVGWVSEACFAIRAPLFARLRGFDKAMRYHEAHDFHARLSALGYGTVFTPTDVVRHRELDSRLRRRQQDERQGRLHYYQKHWGMSEKVFDLLFGM